MGEPKQILIIRTDTNPKMRKGKMIAQGAHASEKAIFDLMVRKELSIYEAPVQFVEYSLTVIKDSPIDKWMHENFKKIVLGAPLNKLIEIYQEAKKMNIPCALIEDSGLTEFGGEVTITACSIGPDNPNKIDVLTKNLKLL